MGWMPSKQAALLAFCVNFSAALTAAPATYGMTAPDAVTLAALVTAASSTFTAATTETTRTAPSIAAKDVALAEATALVRLYGKIIKANRGVTDAAKVNLGIHLDDATPTRLPPPNTPPLLSIVASQVGVLTMRYADANTPDSRAKPSGVLALELYASTSNTVVSDPAMLEFKQLVTRQPVAVSFGASERGKIAYLAARWVNRKGEVGPWSSIVSYVVA